MDEIADDARVDPPLSPEREVLTWERFGSANRDLARTVVVDCYEPDVVIAIARGGLVAEVRTAVLHRKPRSVVSPSWCETDRWVVIPWSARPPVTGAAP